MKRIFLWLKKRRLQKAQRRYAYMKAKREALFQCNRGIFIMGDENTYSKLCATEAEAMELVEQLMRD